VVGCGSDWAKREKGGGGLKGRVFIFQTHSNYEFKPEFEFKHNKMMHQHVCNRELLYFVIELKKWLNAYKNTHTLYSLKENEVLLSKF
jgi:hypothetical protein